MPVLIPSHNRTHKAAKLEPDKQAANPCVRFGFVQTAAMVMSTSLNAANSGGLGRIGTPVGLTRSSLGTTPIGSPALNLNVSDGYGGSSGGHDLQAASLHAMQPRLDMIRMHMTSGQYKTAYEYVLKAEARQPFPDSVDWYTEVSKVFRVSIKARLLI